MGKILSAQQAVEEIFNGNISAEYLYQLARENQIPHIRLGRRRLFDEDKLQEWLSKKLEKSTHGIRKIAE